MVVSVAVGVGVALAKAERDRRGARERSARGRRFGLWPEEQPAPGLRRMALEQLDFAIELLEGESNGALDEHAVHETRKSLKRLRALIRLLAGELGEEEAERENAALRDAGRRLAAARDAEVLVATLDDLRERNPVKLGHRAGVEALRARLAAEREAVADTASRDTATRVQVLAELRAARGRILAWRLPDRDAIETVEPGLSRIYRQGRRRHRRAARGDDDRARLMHMWRKRVKDLRYAAEMLDRYDPGAGRGSARRMQARRWAKRRRRRTDTQAIRGTARQADELGELLGDEHDLVLLATRILAESGALSGDAQHEKAEVGRGLGDRGVAPVEDGTRQDAGARAGAGEDANARPGPRAVPSANAEAVQGARAQTDGDVALAPDTATRGGGPDGKPDVQGPDEAQGPDETRHPDDAQGLDETPGPDEAQGPDETPELRRQDADAGGRESADDGIDEGTRTILLKLIARRRRRLRREALREGGRLYRRRPKAFVARTRDAYKRAARS
jgi:hypothetical protein